MLWLGISVLTGTGTLVYLPSWKELKAARASADIAQMAFNGSRNNSGSSASSGKSVGSASRFAQVLSRSASSSKGTSCASSPAGR